MNLLDEAVKMAVEGGRASPDDVNLVVDIVNEFYEPHILKLGANAALSVAILATKPDASLWLIEDKHEPLRWELVALDNYKIDTCRIRRQVGTADRIAETYRGPGIDLLILDLSSTYEGVYTDLKSWLPHVKDTGYILVHDYEAEDAPASYPDIKKAADEYFGRPPFKKQGWSAVWKKTPDKVEEKPKRGRKKKQ